MCGPFGSCAELCSMLGPWPFGGALLLNIWPFGPWLGFQKKGRFGANLDWSNLKVATLSSSRCSSLRSRVCYLLSLCYRTVCSMPRSNYTPHSVLRFATLIARRYAPILLRSLCSLRIFTTFIFARSLFAALIVHYVLRSLCSLYCSLVRSHLSLRSSCSLTRYITPLRCAYSLRSYLLAHYSLRSYVRYIALAPLHGARAEKRSMKLRFN
jgi:hypothetical protein